MANTFDLKIIACNRVFFDGTCQMLTITGLDGEFGIMANHENMVIATREGNFHYQDADGNTVSAIAGQGFVEIDNNKVTFLADTVETPEELELNKAKAALERARERQQQERRQWEYQMSQASLARALAKLKEGTKHQTFL